VISHNYIGPGCASATSGVELNGRAVVTSNFITGQQRQGIIVQAGTRHTISDNTINASGSVAGDCGLQVNANLTDFQLLGNRGVGNLNGLCVQAGTSNNYEIIGNSFTASTTTDFADGGTGTVKTVWGNQGNPNYVGGSSTTIANGLVGTATNDSAAAGNIGEHKISTVVAASAVTLTTATPADVTTLSLTAGDWDVWGNIAYSTATAPAATLYVGWIHTTSATIPVITNVAGAYTQLNFAARDINDDVIQVGARRVSLASTTTIFLSTQVNFAAGTHKAYGTLQARRIR